MGEQEQNVGMPSPERVGSTLEQLRLVNPIVERVMRAGGTAEDCAVALSEHIDKLVKRLLALEGIAPRRIKLPDGSVVIWHCPDHLIPETDMSNNALKGG